MTDVTEDGQAVVAAYGSYASLRTLMRKMTANGLPPVLDRSFFGAQSGSLTAQQRGSLRFLGLIDSENKPTPTLQALVVADDDTAKRILREAAERAYSEQVALAAINGTQGQLEETFRKSGLTGTTVGRAVSFYLALADDLDLPLSNHFKRPAGPSSNGSGSRRARKRKPTPPLVVTSPPVVAPPATNAETQRAKYVELLMDMAKSSDQDDRKDMLDRIERALGFATPGGPDSSD